MKKWLAPLAILFVLCAADALAQWQVPNYSVPLGRGPGATGFKRAVPGDAGLPLTSNGAAADPTFQQAISSVNKVIHVSTAGNDARDGRSWATAKLTIQAGIDTASTAGKVLVGAGTYTVTAPVYMRAGITLECAPGATITQGSAANLSTLVDFSGFVGGNTATGASIRGCTVNGNRANNTSMWAAATTTSLIYFGNTSYVTIDGNTLLDSTGHGVLGAGQSSLTVSNNVITYTQGYSIFAVELAGNVNGNQQILNNRTDRAITIIGFNNNLLSGNNIVSPIIGGVDNPMTVSVSGTAVTWVSGPTFSGARPGDYFIADEGTVQETIKTVNSTTSLTLNATGGTHTSKLGMIGSNDLLGACCKNTVMTNNYIYGGASFGISLGGIPNQKVSNSIFSNNIMEANGINGFGLIADSGFGGIGAENLTITNNQVINAIYGGAAGCPVVGAGCAHSYMIQATPQGNIFLDGNSSRDDNSRTYSWLGLNSLAAADIVVGPSNQQTGSANPGIYNGISSITLSAGFGTTATTSAIISYGHAHKFTINSSGTGQAAFPSITVNTVASKPAQGSNVIYNCKMTAGTGTFTVLYGEQASTPAAISIGFFGTPVAGSSYEIICQ